MFSKLSLYFNWVYSDVVNHVLIVSILLCLSCSKQVNELLFICIQIRFVWYLSNWVKSSLAIKNESFCDDWNDIVKDLIFEKIWIIFGISRRISANDHEQSIRISSWEICVWSNWHRLCWGKCIISSKSSTYTLNRLTFGVTWIRRSKNSKLHSGKDNKIK